MTPQTDVVIGFRSVDGFRTEEYLEKCILSVEKNTHPMPRLIVIDDASDSTGKALVDNLAGRFRDSVLIRTQTQNWFSRAHNKGLRLVRTPRAIILNSDTEVGEGWLEELYDVWRDVEDKHPDKRVGLVGSVLNDTVPMRWRCTFSPHYVTMHAVLIDMAKCFAVAEKRGTPGEIFDISSPLTIHIRSDVELSHRLNLLGFETVESFRSKVGHHGGKSWGHALYTIPQTLAEVEGL